MVADCAVGYRQILLGYNVLRMFPQHVQPCPDVVLVGFARRSAAEFGSVAARRVAL